MNVLMVLKYHPFSQRGIVWGGKTVKDRPRFRWVRGVTGAHVTFQGGCDDSSWRLTCTTSTSALHVHESGDTVGDYIQRGPLRGGGLPGLSCDGGRYVRPKGKLVG